MKKMFVILALWLSGNSVFAQVENLGLSKLGLAVNDFVVSQDGVIFAATDRGVFYLYENEFTDKYWVPVYLGYTTVVVIELGKVIVGDYGRGVAYCAIDSIDVPESWHMREVTSNVWDIAITPTALYFGTDSGVFRSFDQGLSWQACAALGTLDSTVFVLATDDVTGCIFAGTNEGVFRSFDGGASWEKLWKGDCCIRPHLVRALAVSPDNEVFAGTHKGEEGVLRWGTIWRWNVPLSGLDLNDGVNDFAFIHGKVYAATWGGIFESSDHGDVWRKVSGIAASALGVTKEGDLLIGGHQGDGVFQLK